MAERAAHYRLKAQVPSEALVLNAVLRYLKVERRVAWAHRFNAGAAPMPGAKGKTQWVRFGFTGCPDVLGQLKDGRLLAVECKRPGGARREAQIAFIELASAHGAVACFAESVDDVVAAIREAVCA